MCPSPIPPPCVRILLSVGLSTELDFRLKTRRASRVSPVLFRVVWRPHAVSFSLFMLSLASSPVVRFFAVKQSVVFQSSPRPEGRGKHPPVVDTFGRVFRIYLLIRKIYSVNRKTCPNMSTLCLFSL